MSSPRGPDRSSAPASIVGSQSKTTIEAGAELLSGPRGDDMRIPRGWEKFDEEAIDQLDDDELAQQWEYNVVDPTNPQISTSTSEKS